MFMLCCYVYIYKKYIKLEWSNLILIRLLVDYKGGGNRKNVTKCDNGVDVVAEKLHFCDHILF